jgi:hypothetical protein
MTFFVSSDDDVDYLVVVVMMRFEWVLRWGVLHRHFLTRMAVGKKNGWVTMVVEVEGAHHRSNLMVNFLPGSIAAVVVVVLVGALFAPCCSAVRFRFCGFFHTHLRFWGLVGVQIPHGCAQVPE